MDFFDDIYNQTEIAVKKDVELYEAQEQLKGRIKQKVKTEVIQEWLTLDNIYNYASDEELETIVHSIIGRFWEQQIKDNNFIISKDDVGVLKPTDKELHEVAKGLRTPK